MAKGQHLSQHQQKIVKRYYEHLDTLAMQKLGEAVGELYLCTDDKKAARLWATVATALKKTPVDPRRAAAVVEKRDVKGLAELVNGLSRK